ncbi:MAG: NfeD family protein [Xanthomonadaceae bacterium]|jgi:membrane protein implicated in regulation of membrane protease activity|nr:NfeD family protein [Xanthomonadaceae bacterium]
MRFGLNAATIWAAMALILMAAETMAPGAFMLWMGLAAAAVFLGLLVWPDMPLLVQTVAFIVLSFVSIQIYRVYVRPRIRKSDKPLLNQRAQQLVGRVSPLDQAIIDGQGRLKLDDAYWMVTGPDLPAGERVRVIAVEADNKTLKVQQVA